MKSRLNLNFFAQGVSVSYLDVKLCLEWEMPVWIIFIGSWPRLCNNHSWSNEICSYKRRKEQKHLMKAWHITLEGKSALTVPSHSSVAGPVLNNFITHHIGVYIYIISHLFKCAGLLDLNGEIFSVQSHTKSKCCVAWGVNRWTPHNTLFAIHLALCCGKELKDIV